MNRRFFLRLAGTAGAALLMGPGKVFAAKSAQDLAGEALDLLGAGHLDEALEILGRAKRLDPRDDRVRPCSAGPISRRVMPRGPWRNSGWPYA